MDKYIAITGMSCRFAGSENLSAFWIRVLNGLSAISESENTQAKRYLLEDPSSFCNITSLNGGYLKDLWQVKATSLHVSQNAISGTNPEDALAAELAIEALRDTNAATNIPHDRIGVMIGYSPGITPTVLAWCQHSVFIDQTMELIRRCFPNGKPEEFKTLRNNLISALPQYDSRNISTLFHHTLVSSVTDRCDITGPAYCIDRGDISSHAAIEAACDSLLTGRIDMALAGGIQGLLTPQLLMLYSRLGYLSKSGVARPYGSKADGTVLGEGGGFLVLKRLSDALNSGDRIYAVIPACAVASDGNAHKTEGGLAAAIKQVKARAPQSSANIDFIEANGTGIPALDKAELKVIASSVIGHSNLPLDTIPLGSVKALIGNCGAASGTAGVIKAALSLYHRIIPPAQEANDPALDLKLNESPLYLNTRPRPWIHNDAGAPRRAIVSSLSVGGGAGYLILEQSN